MVLNDILGSGWYIVCVKEDFVFILYCLLIVCFNEFGLWCLKCLIWYFKNNNVFMCKFCRVFCMVVVDVWVV